MFRYADVGCMCLVCILWQSSMMPSVDLQFDNAGQVCMRREYGRCILQKRSYDFLVGSHECLLLFT